MLGTLRDVIWLVHNFQFGELHMCIKSYHMIPQVIVVWAAAKPLRCINTLPELVP